MIKRNSSKINNYLVNSAHEDHLTVAKAIRDDGPITDLNSVIKSINFETDRDGAYILRKPIVRKDYSYNPTSDILLSNRVDILHTYTNNTQMNLSISDTTKIILKFYDNHLTLHEYEYNNSFLANAWLTIVDSYNTADTTILNIRIDHKAFLNNVDYDNNYNSILEEWNWQLNTDPYIYEYPGQVKTFVPRKILKRLVKVYPHETQEHTYIFEILTPELNTFTTSLDTGNANALEANLLLDNPYAVRDLYNYGYVSCTKILAYVPVNETITASGISANTISELTEIGPYSYRLPSSGDTIVNYGYKLLASTNPKVFNSRFLILKAFLTTAITSSKYYCCWEVSKDGGVSWEECPEFVDKNRSAIIRKRVCDLTHKEITQALASDTLTESGAYMVTKPLVPIDMSTYWLSIDNTISQRPDVLILEYPNLSYKYRFQVYTETLEALPSPNDIVCGTNLQLDYDTYVDTSSSTCAVSGITFYTKSSDYHVLDTKIQSTFRDKNNTAITGYINDSGSSQDSSFALSSGNTFTDENSNTRVYPGNSLVITASSGYCIKNIQITIGRNYHYYSNIWVGGVLGIIKNPVQYLDTTDNPYELMYIDRTTSTYVYSWKNLWLENSSIKTVYVPYYDSEAQKITLTDLTACISDADKETIVEQHRSPGDTQPHSLITGTSIAQIIVTYSKTEDFNNIYLISSTGEYQVPYSDSTVLVDYSNTDHDRLFAGKFYYNENQAQLLVYSDNYVYVSGTNSAVMKSMSSLTLPEKVTKIISWRGYLLLFTSRNIYLAKYDSTSDTYNLKTLSNSVGVSELDAETVSPILNSIYFKSGNKIFKLVPNLYSASDDILNVHQISNGVNDLLEKLYIEYPSARSFSYADADTYSVLIAWKRTNNEFTYCFVYNFNTKLWNLHKYPISFNKAMQISITEAYLESDDGIYHFRESFKEILSLGFKSYKNIIHIGYTNPVPPVSYYDVDKLFNIAKYADYYVSAEQIVGNIISPEEYPLPQSGISVIPFTIDFGQKSSNYTIDKQFLETKLVLATLSSKDTFPLTIDIYTDGIQFKDLHWDANTDSALWKNSLSDVGTLNTDFYLEDTDFNGILRQLIVKYSGRGKTIRHIISGESNTLFKFYSMDIRARILPKKQ